MRQAWMESALRLRSLSLRRSLVAMNSKSLHSDRVMTKLKKRDAIASSPWLTIWLVQIHMVAWKADSMVSARLSDRPLAPSTRASARYVATCSVVMDLILCAAPDVSFCAALPSTHMLGASS